LGDGEKLSCLFVCLNPSTATETEDDPTVRRCIGFAKRLGYSRLTVCNIFALRSTNPKALYNHADPVGPENLEHIAREAVRHELLVAAWGNHGELRSRGVTVMNLLCVLAEAVHVLGINATGQPKHPLYLRANTQPRRVLAGEATQALTSYSGSRVRCKYARSDAAATAA
jgi:hypothetical protein